MQTHGLNSKNSGFEVNEISYKNPYNIYEFHRHTYYEIFLFETGYGGTQTIDLNSYEICDKTLFIVAPGQVHHLTRKSDENGILLQFTQEFLNNQITGASVDALFALKSSPITTLSNTDYEVLKKSFNYLFKLKKSEETYKTEKVSHYFAFTIFQILGVLESSNSTVKKDSITLNFLLLAEKHFITERKIANYAKLLNIAVSKLNYVIKKDLGKPPSEIIQELLIIEIKRLIVLEQMTHKEISFHLNFDSPSTYNRFVKKHLGCNPSEVLASIELHKY